MVVSAAFSVFVSVVARLNLSLYSALSSFVSLECLPSYLCVVSCLSPFACLPLSVPSETVLSPEGGVCVIVFLRFGAFLFGAASTFVAAVAASLLLRLLLGLLLLLLLLLLLVLVVQVRAFADEEVVHSEGEVDPVKDLNTISSELRLKDLERAQRLLEDAQKSSRQQKAADKAKKLQEEVLQAVIKLLEEGKWVQQGKERQQKAALSPSYCYKSLNIQLSPPVCVVRLFFVSFCCRLPSFLCCGAAVWGQLELFVDEPLRRPHVFFFCAFSSLRCLAAGNWKAAEVEILNEYQFLTAKTVVYLVNMSEKDFIRQKNKWLAKIHAWVQENVQGPIIPYSAVFENKLAELPDDEARENYIKVQRRRKIPLLRCTDISMRAAATSFQFYF